MTSNSGLLSKLDLFKAYVLSMIFQPFAFNYETMQSPGWVLSLSGCLNKIYGDDPDLLSEKYNKYFQFYNTNPLLNPIVAGVVISMEEGKAEGITDTCLALRTGLMGSLAGLGDSLFWVTGKTIFCSIAAYSAVEGSAVGLFISLLMYVTLIVLRYFFFKVGYTQGAKFITSRTAQLRNLTNSAVIIGLCIIGAMIPSMVSFQTNLVFQMGETSEKSFDSFINSLLPNLMPVGITAAIYWGLKSKHMTTVRMIWIIVVICVVLAFAGIV